MILVYIYVSCIRGFRNRCRLGEFVRFFRRERSARFPRNFIFVEGAFCDIKMPSVLIPMSWFYSLFTGKRSNRFRWKFVIVMRHKSHNMLGWGTLLYSLQMGRVRNVFPSLLNPLSSAYLNQTPFITILIPTRLLHRPQSLICPTVSKASGKPRTWGEVLAF